MSPSTSKSVSCHLFGWPSIFFLTNCVTSQKYMLLFETTVVILIIRLQQLLCLASSSNWRRGTMAQLLCCSRSRWRVGPWQVWSTCHSHLQLYYPNFQEHLIKLGDIANYLCYYPFWALSIVLRSCICPSRAPLGLCRCQEEEVAPQSWTETKDNMYLSFPLWFFYFLNNESFINLSKFHQVIQLF